MCLLYFCIDNSRMFPSVLIAKLYDTVKFRCISIGSVSWNFSHGPLPINVRVSGNVLTILNAHYYNCGIYECRGDTEEKYFWSGATVKVAAQGFLNVYRKFESLM